jgi:hypothetical protein
MTMATPAANDAVALDAALLWRDDVLAFRHLAGRGVLSAGNGPDALGPIQGEGFAFARLDAGGLTIAVHDGAIAVVRRGEAAHEIVHGPADVRLLRGDVLDLPVGALTLRASAVAPIPLALDAPRGPRARGALFHVALAAAAHAAVLGLSLHAALASSPDQAEDDRVAELRALIIHSEAADTAREPAIDASPADGLAQGHAKSPRVGDGRAGGGARAAGAEGKLGSREAASTSRGRYAVPERVKRDQSPSLAREEALSDAAKFGMIGLLGQGPSVPVAATWTADLEAHGEDTFAARGAMWAQEMGESRGLGGLGLSGIGEGGGGIGEGIGLAAIGTLGHLAGPAGQGTGGSGTRSSGSGRGWLTGTHRSRGPVCRCGVQTLISGRLPAEVVQRVVRQNFGRFRLCYENGLRANPTLEGRITVRFVIGRDGAVSSADNAGSDLPDPTIAGCVTRAFYGLSFPPPEDGVVFVTYPIVFSPSA